MVTFFDVFFLAVVVTVTFTTHVPLVSVLMEVLEILHFFAYLEDMVREIFTLAGVASPAALARVVLLTILLGLEVIPKALVTTMGAIIGASDVVGATEVEVVASKSVQYEFKNSNSGLGVE